MSADLLLAFFLTSAALAAMPGPDILYVFARGLAQGRLAGLVAALGLVTGLIAHTTVTALGVGVLIAGFPSLLLAVKVLGGLYLIYLGVKVLRADPDSGSAGAAPRKALAAIYRQTIVMNLLNPKVTLFFLAYLPQFVRPQGPPPAAQLAILGGVFMAAAFLVMGGTGVAAGFIRRLLPAGPRAARRGQVLSGLFFVVLGLYLIGEGWLA
ncbi:MAG: LysE family translocator [Hyphomicrobiales bacterium]|nr:LysE family translocator [Hyphomicrobiales bacterium]MCP5371719.1 LysE family translocator [Hyphomicrobiales bacterium]